MPGRDQSFEPLHPEEANDMGVLHMAAHRRGSIAVLEIRKREIRVTRPTRRTDHRSR